MPWPLPTSEPELLTLAKSYPFAAPAQSYLFRQGAAVPLDPGLSVPDLYRGRTAVIAHGSNRSPDQLRRKFGKESEIPVTRAWLADYDVVFSAHVAMYGSIAANLQHAPGVRACVFITWLTDTQLTRMHETELGGENYFFGSLDGIDLVLEQGPQDGLHAARVYLSTRGCVAVQGRPVGLAAVEAQGRTHAVLPQASVQEEVRRRHRADEDLDEFILRNIRDRARRAALIAEMGAQSLPAAAPHFQAIEV